MSLHDRIEAAVRERMAVAQAAATEAGPDWDAGDRDLSNSVTTPAGSYVVTGPYDYLAHEIRLHVAANDPARIIRDCERDLKVLERHGPAYEIPGRWICRNRCRPVPCAEIADLAEAYGITEEEP